jgi:hypothetical protein
MGDHFPGANQRSVHGLSAVFTATTSGTYQVGLCAYSPNASNWNSNEYAYVSAMVFTQ